MEKYIEKKMRKYVIATLGNPTQYLKKTPAKKEYFFTKDIEIATKASNKKIMQDVLNYYYYDIGLNIKLVVVPIDITYELIDEDMVD